MQPQHEPYCDHQHLPRQRCNDALAPAPDPVAAFEPPAVEAEALAAVMSADEAAAETAPNLLREAASEAPAPTRYAGREWQRSAESLEVPDYLASNAEHALDVAVDRGGRIAGKAALIVGGLAVAGVAAYLLRDGSVIETALSVFTGEGHGSRQPGDDQRGGPPDDPNAVNIS
jgi:hypothetical protein